MKFSIAAYLSGAAEEHAPLIDAFAEEVAAFLAERSYGESVKDLGIRLVVVEPAVAGFIKPVSPKYYPGRRKIKNERTVRDYLDYEIRLDYGAFMRASDKRGMLARELVDSLEALDVPPKAEDFDKARLRAYLETRFSAQGA